jgi:hypothetical protein
VFVAVSVVLGIGLTIGAVLWGQSDTGQIDVSATIVNSQTDGSQDGNAPTSNTSNELAGMPNGGLVPQGGDIVPAPEPIPVPDPVATTTATTTVEGEMEVETSLPAQEGDNIVSTEEVQTDATPIIE